jgi:hypothetical protein
MTKSNLLIELNLIEMQRIFLDKVLQDDNLKCTVPELLQRGAQLLDLRTYEYELRERLFKNSAPINQSNTNQL